RRIAQAQAESQLEQDRRVARGLANQKEPEAILEIHTPEADIQIEIPAAGPEREAEPAPDVQVEVPAPEFDAIDVPAPEPEPSDEEITIEVTLPDIDESPGEIINGVEAPSFSHLGECL